MSFLAVGASIGTGDLVEQYNTRGVLIASADLSIVDAITELLPSTGALRYQAERVNDISGLLAQPPSTTHDVILLDMVLAQDDAVRLIRQIQDATELPIVILVCRACESLISPCLEAGVQEYIRKEDLKETSLRRALGYAISNHRATDLRRRLEHSDRLAALGQLTAGVAHELNNPAAYVLSNLRQIEEVTARMITDGGKPNDLELILDMTKDCRRGVELIASISRELKFFAHSGDEEEEIDLEEIIANTCTMTLNEIRYRARLERDIGSLPTIVGSRSKLSQVFVNLLINAAQSIGDGKLADNQITVSARQEQTKVIITIEDTGCGISAANQAKIFEPYFTTKPKGQGTGLGLPICAEIVANHGGSITVESEVGKGTRFIVKLPIETGHVVTPPPPESALPKAKPKKSQRVLLIDDEPLLLKSLARMLKARVKVVTASGGADALDILSRDSDFGAIICDLMMPDVDGIHVYEAVQANHPQLAEKLFFLSGGVFTDRMSTFLQETQVTILDKPVSRETLFQALATH